MTQINFYQADDLIYKSIAPLLSKILTDNKKALIFSQDQELLKEIDDKLWSFSKTKFIPHATIFENNAISNQPILLTNIQKNDNKADFLIMLDSVNDEFLKDFEKTFFFFGDNYKNKARELWVEYKNKSITLSFFKKEQNNWMKVSI